ncbi:MAG: ABC transporter permease [Betaproteobacteria bacterium]|jgi:NitT/TauT family transport system permease protein|nr:ABC transporter permease [Betaproteobacteria bacterium]MBK7793416.1 ABC transporter permease [Betaproteobacteria bacterium]
MSLASLAPKLKTPAVILALLAIWQAAVGLFDIREFILPTPLSALEHLFLPQPDANYNWMVHIRATLLEIGLSFVITSVVGISIAIALAWSEASRKVSMPLFVFVNSLPIIAIAPILVLWSGYGLKTNILIAFLVSFFPVVINTLAGLAAIEEELLDLVKYLHGTKLQVFLKLRIPNSLPYIFTGLKICSTMCVVGAIVGEFIASDRGLGYIIINSQYTMDSPPIYAGLMLVSLFGVSLFGLVGLAERILMPWARRGVAEK